MISPLCFRQIKTEPAISIQAIAYPISTTSQLQSVLIINCSSLIAEQPDRDSRSQVESCVFVMGTSVDAADALWANYESTQNVQKKNRVPKL